MRNVSMIYHKTEHGTIYCGDSLDVLSGMADESVDCIVTDPPYGLSFMGKKWDYDVPSTELWTECLRVLRPGGHLLAFAGTRTQHRMAVRIEDAGFEIRDMIAWIYGSGFPKSLNIGKAVDKMQGNEREIVGKKVKCETGLNKGITVNKGWRGVFPVCKGASPWEGWGTALKPALEPITVARKPISERNIAANVLKHGTGGMNIDGCRVSLGSEKQPCGSAKRLFKNNQYNKLAEYGDNKQTPEIGRFPANLIHDGSDEVLELFPSSSSSSSYRPADKGGTGNSLVFKHKHGEHRGYNEPKSSAARFFYCAKASRSERGEGNVHPTVKPIALMQYLCRLVTPPNGIVLDPFFGSGSTGCAAIREGFRYIGIDISEDYCAIAAKRIDSELQQANIFREMTCR